MLMTPRSILRAGESNKDRSLQKDRIIKSNKIRVNTVKDKSFHAILEHVHVQRISIQSS